MPCNCSRILYSMSSSKIIKMMGIIELPSILRKEGFGTFISKLSRFFPN